MSPGTAKNALTVGACLTDRQALNNAGPRCAPPSSESRRFVDIPTIGGWQAPFQIGQFGSDSCQGVLDVICVGLQAAAIDVEEDEGDTCRVARQIAVWTPSRLLSPQFPSSDPLSPKLMFATAMSLVLPGHQPTATS